ncbi:MAG: ATP-binding protein [Ferrovum sp.]|jgi:hypothetical protein|uniref:ATP-binding protein n=1 Tax=Ferrovum sp. TaxID=2609467 RepID=UPI0013B78543|nr:ATP-binding protein [Ferrovum sp.]NDU90543.1 ATP-binding protein [Ferrovum sp.]
MIPRTLAKELTLAASEYPVVTLLGARQVGKTTLVREIFPNKPWVSLEDMDVRARAETDPRAFLNRYAGGAIFDEVQRLPSLLSYLQGLVDLQGQSGRFVLTGSHQPRLQEAISQSLAGRTALLNLWPLTMEEMRAHPPFPATSFDCMLRGGYPRVVAQSLDIRRFYNGYLQTYVERDVRALIQVRNLSLFQKFLTLLAGRVGQLLNLSSLSNDVGVSATTLREWISVLKSSFLIFELIPFYENVSKRLVKSSKIFFADVGMVCHLLGIHSVSQLERDPLRGSLYENFMISEVMKSLAHWGRHPELFFYRDSHGVEVDLVIRHNGSFVPIEIKSSSTFSPEFIKGILQFRRQLDRPTAQGYVLYNGEDSFTLQDITIINPLDPTHRFAEIMAVGGG